MCIINDGPGFNCRSQRQRERQMETRRKQIVKLHFFSVLRALFASNNFNNDVLQTAAFMTKPMRIVRG